MTTSEADLAGELNGEWQYHPREGFYDEMLDAHGLPRPHWRELVGALNQAGPAGLAERWREGLRLIHDNGVTYHVYGDPRTTERPWPLDPVPFPIAGDEWKTVEAAIRQRATLLNRILADLYGPQRLLRDRKLPAELILGHPGFLRPCHGAKLSGDTWLHSYSADIARSPDGHWWVLSDRTQAPSGAGYALENRLASLRVLPDVFRASNVRRLAGFFREYRETLRSLAPRCENPRIVVLTPGPFNETYFEHAFLARYLGYTLVEGADLAVRDNRVYLKTLGGLLPVDVIVRRQDDSFCDPLELRGDSILGVAGLVQAVLAGNVAVANALGSGVLESAALSAFLPALSRHILGEDLQMPNIATWWCGDAKPRAWVAEHLSHLVIKPASPALTFEPVFGAKLTAAERSALMKRIEANPGAYAAQEQVSLSTVPVANETGLKTRHLVLRVFAVAAGDSYAIMPGGLTRVTKSLDSLVVSMQHGGGSKDTWVLGDAPDPQPSLLDTNASPLAVSRATFDLPSRVADDLFWLGRYLERFEAAIRTIRAVLPRLYQDTDPSAVTALAVCREVMAAGIPLRPEGESANHTPLTETSAIEMIADEESSTSLRSRAHEIRRLAWLLRDRISADAWRVLQHLDQQFSEAPPPEQLRVSWGSNLLDSAILSLSAFSGLAMENMTRGDGWRFLEIGRRIERAWQILQVVRRGLGCSDTAGNAELAIALELADSTLTYRSRYLNALQPDLVLDLLLLDEGNPRSVAFQLARLHEHVDQLPDSPATGHQTRESRLALSMLTSVQLEEVADLVQTQRDGSLHELDRFTLELISELNSLSEILTRVYFTHVAARQLPVQ